MKRGIPKRLFALTLIGLFVISMFAGVVAAQTGGGGGSNVKKFFLGIPEALFGGGSQFNSVTAKVLFFALIALIIFSILAVAPVIGDQSMWIQAPIALIIAYLSTAYIAPAELYAMLMSYTAMGVALGAILPFLILAVFTFEMAKKDTPGMMFFGKLLWIGFLLLLIYRIGAGIYNDSLTAGIAIIYGIVFVLGLIMIFGWGKIIRMVSKARLKRTERKMKEVVGTAAKREKAEYEAAQEQAEQT